VKIGFDYWQVISHYPKELTILMVALRKRGHSLHVVSAIGKDRVDTVADNVEKAFNSFIYAGLQPLNIHEVVFDHPRESPELKLAKCKELGIEMFFDDRDDVCRLLNANGIMALRVTRKDNSTYDLEADIGGEK